MVQESVQELLQLADYSVKGTAQGGNYPCFSLNAVKATATGLMARTITCVEEPEQLKDMLKTTIFPKGSWVVIPDEKPPVFSVGVQNLIRRRKVLVLTLTLFYDQMLRAQHICERTLQAKVPWKEETIGLDRLSQLYTPQRAEIVRNSHKEELEDSSVALRDCLHRPGGGVTLVLADAGRGKTWLTWSLAHAAATEYVASLRGIELPSSPPPPVPFLIPFSQYKRLTSFNGIVLERLNSFGTLDIRAEGFKYLLSKGRIVLILDGFDEMLELAPIHARENLKEIRRHLLGSSKLVLTSRRTIFPTAQEISDFIGLGGPEQQGLELAVCNLRGFSQEQVRAFHRARGAAEAEINAIVKLPVSQELHASPQMAEYFLDIIKKGVPVNQTELFETVLPLIYDRESDKWVKEGNPPMPAKLQEQFLTEVAFAMWPEGSESPELVQMVADGLAHRYLSKHHLLQPTYDGQLQFEHHVWRDWFMARAILGLTSSAAAPGKRLAGLLTSPLPEYCAKFLAERLDQQLVHATLNDISTSDAAYSNLLRMALMRVPAGADPATRARELLMWLRSPGAFQHRRLEKIRLELLDLREWVFEGTSFDQVVFGYCVLPRQYEGLLTRSRGVTLVDCTWKPDLSTGDASLEKGREAVRKVLHRFITSLDPLKVRNEIASEKMTRDFHIPPQDKGLRCLMKLGYVSVVLEARSKEFYVLDTSRLEAMIQFIATGGGLEDVVACASDIRNR